MRLTLGDLARECKGNSKQAFQDGLVAKVLIVDKRFGGLKDGILHAQSDDPIETADDAKDWNKQAQFRVRRRRVGSSYEQEVGWGFEGDFDLLRDEEGKAMEQLIAEHFKDAAQKEDARSISKPQKP